MKRNTKLTFIASIATVLLMTIGLLAQQGPGPGGPDRGGPGRGMGRGGRGGPGFRGNRQDPRFNADHQDFQFLLAHGDQIRRQVTFRKDGVETLTESDDAGIAAKIQEHVAAMYDRVEEKRPIHMRDPLFAAVFRHADKIEMKLENTEKGVRVVERSEDPYVAKLIQEHAKVVSLFIKNGHAEARKNHSVPPSKAPTDAASQNPSDQSAPCCGQKPCCNQNPCCNQKPCCSQQGSCKQPAPDASDPAPIAR